MPTYEYACTNPDCSHAWEENQSINDSPLTECPNCHQESAKRQISVSSFVLQGGGWAREGYSSK